MNIIPFHENQSEFFNRLEYFKRYQTLPTFLGAFELGIMCGADLSLITKEMSTIFTCDNNQFWIDDNGQNNYLKQNRDALDVAWINKYLDQESENNYNCLLNTLWELLGLIGFDDILEENLFLSESDYCEVDETIKDKQTKHVSIEQELNINHKSTINSKELQNAIIKSVQFQIELEDNRKDLRELAEADGFKNFPPALFINESDFYQAHIDNLRQLSNHISLYYFEEDLENKIIMSKDNKQSVLRIFSSLLFSQILRDFSIKTPKFKTLTAINDYRLNNFNYSLIDSEKKQLYISYACNNIILAGFMGLSAIENKILGKTEVNLDFLNHICTTYDRNILKLFYLPPSVGKYIFTKTASDVAYEGWFDAKLVASMSKGHSGGFDFIDFEENLSKYFIDDQQYKEETGEITDFISLNCANWVLPFDILKDIIVTNGFEIFIDFSDEEVFSNALNIADMRDDFTGCKFKSDLFDFYNKFEEYEFQECSHPALHSLHIASGRLITDTSFYLNFAAAFVENNRPFYAALIIGVFLQLRLFMEDISLLELKPIDRLHLVRILKQISVFPCFEIVQDSIKEFLDYTGVDNPNFAVLKSFIQQPQGPPKNIVRLLRVHNSQEGVDHPEGSKFSSEKIKDHFINALNLCTLEKYRRYSIGEYAFIQMGKSLEGEFYHRLLNIDESTIIEFEKLGVKFNGTTVQKKIETITMGSIFFIIKIFDKLSLESRALIPQITKIITHRDFKTFHQECEFVHKYRNYYAHFNKKPDKLSGEERRIEELALLDRLDRLKMCFENGLFLRVLNNQ